MFYLRRAQRSIQFILLFSALAVTSACGTLSESGQTIVETPAHSSDWRVSTPAEQGLDAEKIATLQQQLQENLPDVRSVLIVRHGHLVFEYYQQGLGETIFTRFTR